MNFSFFSTNKEKTFIKLVEIEAHTTSKSVEESFFLVFYKFLVLINHKLELDDFLRFELVLHEVPAGDSTIRGDRVETEILSGIVRLPSHLPYWISVLLGPNG
jgi:hypothetical protein